MNHWIITVVLFLTSIFTINAQNVERTARILKKRLPEEAQVLESLGNQWYKIDIRGQVFLYHFRGSDKGGYESITKIGEKSPLVVNKITLDDNLLSLHGYVYEELPLNSKIVEILGHNWYFIERENGHIYLYHLTNHPHGAKCLTLVK